MPSIRELIERLRELLTPLRPEPVPVPVAPLPDRRRRRRR